MVQRLNARDDDFEARFEALLSGKRETSEDVDATVRDILKDVRTRGDAALCELTARFDRMEVTPAQLRITPEEIAAAVAQVSEDDRAALTLAHERILAHHERHLPRDERYEDALGVELGHRWTPVDAVGLYVPGGVASYPSSVLMNAVPAKVAGVERIAMVVPTPDGVLNPLVLAAAELAGITEIYRVGGAQAVAALAFGTETIAPVATIVGPGNAYVATAKRQVYGTVGIDSIAGPSEVLVIADETAAPEWLAADLLAQAEHDTAAQSILITTSAALADGTAAAVDAQMAELPRTEIAGQSWADHGAIIEVAELDDAIPLANRLAAEHLELACVEADAERLASTIRHAGAIFIGHMTPEAIGDYVGGTNHVLPTARSARHASGLGVLNFMKRTSILRLDREALEELAPAATRLAQAEGLEGHARSVTIRLAAQD